MKIYNIPNTQFNTPKVVKTSQKPAFTGLLCTVAGNQIFDTGFFRGPKTMYAAADFCKMQFPHGTNILHLGGSNAEEAFSNAMLLDDPKYKIHSLDINPIAYHLAKNNVHSVFSHFFDSFLLRNSAELNPVQKMFKSKFEKYFEPTYPPSSRFNNSETYMKMASSPGFVERYFSANSKGQALVELVRPEESDIMNIDKFRPNLKVGVMYARNLFYYPSKNNVLEVIIKGEKKNTLSLHALERAINNAHKRIENRGFLVLGDSSKEHLYIAEEGISEPVKKFSEINMLVSSRIKDNEEIQNLSFYETSPLEKMLSKDNKFRPVFWDAIDEVPGMRVPMIWQKMG